MDNQINMCWSGRFFSSRRRHTRCALVTGGLTCALPIYPRGMFAAAARFDQPVDENWPDEALDRWRPDGGSAVVSLTHDPKLDDPALARALNSPAFYIGALGSRKTHAARLERLGAAGFTDKELARI